MTVSQPNSGFESCFFNLPDSFQELNIDARALNEINVAVKTSFIWRPRSWKAAAIEELDFNSLATLWNRDVCCREWSVYSRRFQAVLHHPYYCMAFEKHLREENARGLLVVCLNRRKRLRKTYGSWCVHRWSSQVCQNVMALCGASGVIEFALLQMHCFCSTIHNQGRVMIYFQEIWLYKTKRHKDSKKRSDDFPAVILFQMLAAVVICKASLPFKMLITVMFCQGSLLHVFLQANHSDSSKTKSSHGLACA